MTTKDLLNTNFGDPLALQDSFYQWGQSHCLNKSEIKQFDPITSKFKMVEVPCGSCLYCRSLYKDEWYTRFFLHSQDYKYIYYVTFTYASPDNAVSKGVDYDVINGQVVTKCRGFKYKVALSHMHEISGSCMVKNTNNKFGQLLSFPSVINQSHMQNMFKKLRCLLPDADITYYYCSEYGSNYGHCHHHAIVWCSQPIDRDLFVSAWSRSYCVIEGWKGIRNKQFFSNIVPFRGQSSKDLYYDNGKQYFHQTVSVFDCPFGHVDYKVMKHDTIVDNFHDDCGRNIFGYVCKYLNKNEYNYSQVDDYFFKEGFTDEDSGSKVIIEDGLAVDQEAFRKLHKPFCRCSLLRPIGGKYAVQFADQIAHGNYSIGTDYDGNTLVVPKFFSKKAKQICAPFFLSTNRKGNSSLSRGDMPDIISTLHRLSLWSDIVKTKCYTEQDLEKSLYSLLGLPFDVVFKYKLCFYDVVNRVHYVPKFVSAKGLIFFLQYYDRKTRSYKLCGSVTAEQLYEYYLKCYEDLKVIHDRIQKMTDNEKKLLEEFKSHINDYDCLVNNTRSIIVEQYQQRQVKYHALHDSGLPF